MTFNPVFDRKASGTFTEGKNENSQSIKFGSAGYVIEDDLNELQSINMNRSALINRSIRTSGIINKIHSKSVPTPTPTPAPAPKPSVPADKTYVVKNGDVLEFIAQKFYTYSDYVDLIKITGQLAKYNGLSDVDAIWPGQVLRIPDKSKLSAIKDNDNNNSGVIPAVANPNNEIIS